MFGRFIFRSMSNVDIAQQECVRDEASRQQEGRISISRRQCVDEARVGDPAEHAGKIIAARITAPGALGIAAKTIEDKAPAQTKRGHVGPRGQRIGGEAPDDVRSAMDSVLPAFPGVSIR